MVILTSVPENADFPATRWHQRIGLAVGIGTPEAIAPAGDTGCSTTAIYGLSF